MTAKEFVLDYINNHPENLDENGRPYFSSIYELLKEESSDAIYSEETCGSRWWNNTFQVSEINGKLIGYDWAETTGDDSPYWKGWVFDEDSICYVEPKEVIITKYVAVNEVTRES